MNWSGQRVLVTGGASFIGSHLVDKLLSRGSEVIVADDLSSGRMDNLEYSLKFDAKRQCWVGERVEFYKGDLKERCFTEKVMREIDVVFHLAALHGGRGYINTHPAECCTNMILDQLVFETAHRMNVGKICFASSACVYPTHLQEAVGADYLLREEDADLFVRGKSFADQEYGWAKLMGEMALRAFHKESGEQDRNFTYVDDIADALILAAEKIEDGTPVNAGLSEHIRVREVCEKIFDYTGFRPKKIMFDRSKPQGVASRAADLTRARRLLDWEPRVSFEEGLRRTIDWYFSTKNRDMIQKQLHRLLFER